jgi:hypothetical protein
MARYVVLAFEGGDEANQKAVEFVKQVAAREDLPYKVEALVMKPTKFCEPYDGHRKGKTESGWTRGSKWGMWVCSKCKMPSRAWGQSYGAVLSSGKNLLNSLFPNYPRIWELPGDEKRYESQFTDGHGTMQLRTMTQAQVEANRRY